MYQKFQVKMFMDLFLGFRDHLYEHLVVGREQEIGLDAGNKPGYFSLDKCAGCLSKTLKALLDSKSNEVSDALSYGIFMM